MNPSFETWRDFVFDTGRTFDQKAVTIFRHQFSHIACYRQFCEELGIEMPDAGSSGRVGGRKRGSSTENRPEEAGQEQEIRSENKPEEPAILPEELPVSPEDIANAIPLMPIQAFRDAHIRPDYVTRPQAVFRSSGTTGSRRATHGIADLTLYEESCYRGFSRFYDPQEFSILAYLPGYADNPESSLIAMIDSFIRRDETGWSRFLPLDRPLTEADLIALTEKESGSRTVTAPESRSEFIPESQTDADLKPKRKEERRSRGSRRIMLFGAAFGLLDLVEKGAPDLPPGSVVVETGGMKTHRREMSREQLHEQLAEGFGLTPADIHSEYGMAEMCSQAWDAGEGRFRTPPWLRITIRNPENPLRELPCGEEGLIGVMDLANVHSLSFFLTQDRGVAWPDGSFRVLGRWDHAELRGCNFLMD